ncbi:MAG: hypothetical protein LBI74_07130 [Synergistaceae bacterium]|nr:hypothetical protein [Synergistaceae bacterium]
MSKKNNVLWLLLSLVLFAALSSSLALADVMTAGGVKSAAVKTDGILPARSADDDDSYRQILYDYEEGSGSRLWGPGIDWRGQYYYLKKNAARTVSYIFLNYGPDDKTDPFITINGNVSTFDIASDANSSYVYYKLEDENTIYRLPLEEGASNPVPKTFTMDGTDFLFTSFTMAQDPNQFLLYSKDDDDLKVKIGLFSFDDGGTEPTSIWTCRLPAEWKDNFKPISIEDLGYGVIFEASTGNIWFYAQRSLATSDGGRFNARWWFFSGLISGSGELSPYIPSPEIHGVDNTTGHLKLLSIERYGRIVTEYDGDKPDNILSIRELDQAFGLLKSGDITTWTDDDGDEKSIGNFYSGYSNSNSNTNDWYQVGRDIDGQGNFYLVYQIISSNGSGKWSRFALFSPGQSSAVGIGTPDPSANNVTFKPDDEVVLKSSLPSMPTGTTITGSRWEVYQTEVYRTRTATPYYTGTNYDASNTHTVDKTLPAGSYTWRVAYDWVKEGIETVNGSTKWSPDASISVAVRTQDTNQDDTNTDSTNNSSGGSGGCDTGFGLLTLAAAAYAVSRKYPQDR